MGKAGPGWIRSSRHTSARIGWMLAGWLGWVSCGSDLAPAHIPLPVYAPALICPPTFGLFGLSYFEFDYRTGCSYVHLYCNFSHLCGHLRLLD
uniref:Secreted protein n=2 Tax=Triticum urartu TaxID=4572 RepID=A0A8R7TLC3_TRIUA